MSLAYSFQIPGLPIAKGRARSRVIKAKATGKHIATHYTPKETRNYEAEVRWIAEQARGGKPLLTCACSLRVTLVFPIPASWPKWKAEAARGGLIAHTGKPDCSNLVKSIEDACNGVIWRDDGQAHRIEVEKLYGPRACAHVEIYRRTAVLPADCTRADLLALEVQ